MKPIDHIYNYCKLYGNVENNNGKPNWISVTFRDDFIAVDIMFDFKNDKARRAFGALCHVLYTSAEHWRIRRRSCRISAPNQGAIPNHQITQPMEPTRQPA